MHSSTGPQNSSGAVVGQVLAANTAPSPLLALPRELRDRIYEEVFGGNVICVKTLPDKAMGLYCWNERYYNQYRPTASHHLCRSPPSLQMTGDDIRHECCQVTTTMNIDLFFANHQVSREASDIFWESNTFQFEEPTPFMRFCNDTSLEQQAKIRNLRFLMRKHTTAVSVAWEKALQVNQVRWFSNLQHLSIHLMNHLTREQWTSLFTNGVFDDLRVKGLFHFRRLPRLRSVDVHLSQHSTIMPAGLSRYAQHEWTQMRPAYPNHGLSTDEVEELEFFLQACVLKQDADPVTIWDDSVSVRARTWDSSLESGEDHLS